MKILITGGTGFLGRHIVWRFAETGAEVVFTGRNGDAASEVLSHAHGNSRWLRLEHGTADAGSLLAEAAAGCDTLVHCAALSSPWGRPEEFYRANVASTVEALRAGRIAGVRRLVHISTPSLYFDFRDRLAIREDAPLPPPVNEYARTKAMAEAAVCADPLPETVILRPRALFGPWDQTLAPRLLRVMREGAVPIMRGGRIELDLTYVSNAVDAVWLSVTEPLPRPLATYNVSNGEPQELLPLLQMMSREFGLPLRTRNIPWPLVSTMARGMELAARLGNGREPRLTRYSAGVLAFSQTLDISAIRNDLGYHPKVTINEGMTLHAGWWRQNRGEVT